MKFICDSEINCITATLVFKKFMSSSAKELPYTVRINCSKGRTCKQL